MSHEPRTRARKRAKQRGDKANAFIADIIAVYKKHHLALGHEDGQGAFTVVPLDERHEQWLLEAYTELVPRP